MRLAGLISEWRRGQEADKEIENMILRKSAVKWDSKNIGFGNKRNKREHIKGVYPKSK